MYVVVSSFLKDRYTVSNQIEVFLLLILQLFST